MEPKKKKVVDVVDYSRQTRSPPNVPLVIKLIKPSDCVASQERPGGERQKEGGEQEGVVLSSGDVLTLSPPTLRINLLATHTDTQTDTYIPKSNSAAPLIDSSSNECLSSAGLWPSK